MKTTRVIVKPGHCGSMYMRISRGAAGPTIQEELVEALNKDRATVYKGAIFDFLAPATATITREKLTEALNQAPNHTLVFFRCSQSERPFPCTSKVCTKYNFRIEYGEAKDPLLARSYPLRTTFMLTDTDTAATCVNPATAPTKRQGVQIEERCHFPTTVAEWQKMPKPERRALVDIIMESLVEDDRQELVKGLQEKVQGLTVEQLQALSRQIATTA